MKFLRTISSAAAVSLIAMAAPTDASAVLFTVDEANSSVSLTQTGTGLICDLMSCGVSADLAPGLGSTSFDLGGAGASSSFDFLTLSGLGTGATEFSITATLAFSAPGFAVTGEGAGGALLLAGSIIYGVLTWNDLPQTLTLTDGSVVTVDFLDGAGFFLGKSETVLASVTLDSVSAAVPLPASVLFLLGGLGALALVARRRPYVVV